MKLVLPPVTPRPTGTVLLLTVKVTVSSASRPPMVNGTAKAAAALIAIVLTVSYAPPARLCPGRAWRVLPEVAVNVLPAASVASQRGGDRAVGRPVRLTVGRRRR